MRNYIPFLFLSFLMVSSSIFGQNGTPSSVGARGLAMGDASVTFKDINSGFSNQAGLAWLDGLGIGLFGEARFLVPGLNSFGAVVAYPTKSGTFGINMNYFGYEQYNEQKIGIAYARKLFDKVSIGAQFDYLATRLAEYGSASSFTFELGVQAVLLKSFRIGAHIFSPARIKIGEEDLIPTVLNVGGAWDVSDKFLIALQVEKDLDYPASFKGGLEYKVVEILSLRAGVSTQPIQSSFGIGLHVKGLNIDLTSAYHQILGFTPGVGISYNLNKKANAKKEE